MCRFGGALKKERTAHNFGGDERAKAKALGYQEARRTAAVDPPFEFAQDRPFGDGNQKRKSNGNGQEQRQKQEQQQIPSG